MVDEAAQALEASCWIPLQLGARCVLGGDHLQLPPTIHSNDPGVVKALERTLFERAMSIPGATQRMLETQYRMHADICRWSSDEMYVHLVEKHVRTAMLTTDTSMAPTASNAVEMRMKLIEHGA